MKNWRKAPRRPQSIEGVIWTAGAPRVFPSKYVYTVHYDYFIPLFGAKVKQTELPLVHSGDCSELRCSVWSLSVRPGASSGLLPPLRSLGGNQEKRGKSDTLTGLGVCQSVMCARGESTQQSAHTPHLPPKTPRWIMKYSHRRCPSDCQHGHLTNFSETHPKAQRAGPPSEPQTEVIVVPLFAFFFLFILKSATRIPGYPPQWNVRTSVMRGAFRQLPLIDRHIQLPFRPLLYSTPSQASPWQSKPTCQSAALIVHWDGFHFHSALCPALMREMRVMCVNIHTNCKLETMKQQRERCLGKKLTCTQISEV